MRRPPGLAPGTLIASHDAEGTSLSMVRYDREALEERPLPASVRPDQLPEPGDGVLWIAVSGLADVEVLERLGERYGLHPLLLEDVVNVGQRPKAEIYDGGVFIIARSAELRQGALDTEQLCFFLADGLVITFEEHADSSPFEPVLQRLRAGRVRLRSGGADYLTYALLDAVVDGFLPTLEVYAERLESYEERLLEEIDTDDLRQLYRIRRDLIALRKAAAPLQEAISAFMREGPEAAEVKDDTLVFLRDCLDHAVRTTDLIDGQRDMASSLMELQLSLVGHRSNEVMKVLTMIATIFIPLSFLAGLYGMNFETSSPWNMPELSWAYAYPTLLGTMAVIAISLLIFFRRRGWL